MTWVKLVKFTLRQCFWKTVHFLNIINTCISGIHHCWRLLQRKARAYWCYRSGDPVLLCTRRDPVYRLGWNTKENYGIDAEGWNPLVFGRKHRFFVVIYFWKYLKGNSFRGNKYSWWLISINIFYLQSEVIMYLVTHFCLNKIWFYCNFRIQETKNCAFVVY